MTKPTTLILILIFIIRISSAQIAPEKINDKMQEANEYILSEEYREALIILNDLRDRGFENENVLYKTGLCYLNTSEKSKAYPLFKKAVQNISRNYQDGNPLETHAPLEAMLYLGDACRIKNDFKQAISCYQKYARLKSGTQNISQKRIKECYIAEKLQKNPIEVTWKMLENTINQGIANLNPVVSADGKTLVFTRKEKFYDAILISHFADGMWQEPENITTQLGSDGEFYPTSLSADGNRLLLNSYNVLSSDDIYESTWNGSRWTKMKKLDEEINSRFTELNASYSPDGNTIFFASNRDKGFGGYDIYKSDRRADNSWSHAINLGSVINTPADEKAPHLVNDGETLVFSSNGHIGMGGYDFFYISYPLSNESRVRNIGFPVNTVTDDLSFYPVLKYKTGFIAKAEREREGESFIYQADYTKFSDLFEIPVKADLNFAEAINDSISLFLVDNQLKDTVEQRTITGNVKTLDFDLYPGSFSLLSKTSSQNFEEIAFELSPDFKASTVQLPLSFRVLKTENLFAENKAIADTLIIQNINFDFNSIDISAECLPMLNQIANLMTKNPQVKVTIMGYTDNIGESTYNLRLSQKRAEKVKQYLTSKQVENSRMKAIGVGSEGFIAINSNPDGSDNPEGRKLNRRAELVLENTPNGLVIKKISLTPQNLRIEKLASNP